MNSSHKKSDESPAPPEKSTVVLLLGTITDTTWRMFVPSIGLTIVGVIMDNWLHTKPWLTLSGILVGATIAALLVRRQMRRLK